MKIQPFMKAGSSRGKQGTVVHGIDVDGIRHRIDNSGWISDVSYAAKSLCRTSCGPRSAGWCHMSKESVNCERCLKAMERLKRLKL